MQYSIKKPRGFLWRTNLSLETIRKELDAGWITEEWLICPLGEAGRAVPLRDFLANPAMFGPEDRGVSPGDKVPDRESLGEDLTPAPGETAFDRRHDLDALRAAAMLLGIGLHAALAYVTFRFWPIYDDRHSGVFDLFLSMVHGFRMPLFFMISGFFTAMLWRKRGLVSLLAHRAKRILFPLGIFLFTIIPLQLGLVAILVGLGGSEVSPDAAQGPPDSLWEAAKQNDLEALESFLENGEDLDRKSPEHQLPALNWAALNGSTEAAKRLIEAGADIDVLSGDNSTPLGHAAFTGRAGVVALLIENGANLNNVNHHQSTALDSTYAGWEIIEWVRKVLGLQIEKDTWEEGRVEVRKLLRDAGGKRKAELDEERKARKAEAKESRDGENETRESFDLREAYRSILGWPIFHVGHVFHHLWFLWFLCLLVAPFLVYAAAANVLNWQGPPKWLFRSPMVFLWLVPLTMIPQWFHNDIGPDTSIALFPFPHILLLYAVYFFFGALYFDCDDREGKISRFWWLKLPLALFVLYPAAMALTHGQEAGWIPAGLVESGGRGLTVMLQVLYTWFMIFGLMGLFRAICSRENGVIRYVSDSSYWLYAAHMPLIFLAQFLVKPLDLPAFVKFTIVCAGVTGVLLISYEWMIRYTWLGTLLNGKRVRPSKRKSSPENASEETA